MLHFLLSSASSATSEAGASPLRVGVPSSLLCHNKLPLKLVSSDRSGIGQTSVLRPKADFVNVPDQTGEAG